MATLVHRLPITQRRPDLLSGTPRAHAIDRWIFVAMAAWFIGIVLLGFIPDALMKIGLVQAGQRPPFPIIMHVHATVMGAFLLLLLSQAWLMATGRRELHMRIGIAAFAFVPVLVVVGVILAPTIYHQVLHVAEVGPANLRPLMQQRAYALENILLLQLRIGLLFPLLMAIALKARGENAGLHKRMIFLATAVPLPAAIDRMNWLPNTLPATPVGSDLWILVALSPLFMWDLLRNRRVHEAYQVWLAIYVPVALLAYGLWDTPSWHAAARQIMSV